mgnify:CR=1 FL=1
MAGTLYVVGTPIGNLSDFSPRAIQTLQEVDFIAAEDTRVTQKLLSYFQIKKPMISYYQHNLRERGEEILARIESGENCAMQSDRKTTASNLCNGQKEGYGRGISASNETYRLRISYAANSQQIPGS